MTRSIKSVVTLAAVSAVLVTATGCGGKDPKPEPTKAEPTKTTVAPSSTVSPAPAWPTLTKEEKAAVDEAFKDSDEGDRVFRRLTSDPKAAMANKGAKLRALRKYYYSPQLNQTARVVRELSEKSGKYSGREKIEWRVPTKVDLDSSKRVIEYQMCSSLNTFRVFHGGKEIAQESKPLLFTITTNPSYSGQQISGWRTSKVEETGTCEK